MKRARIAVILLFPLILSALGSGSLQAQVTVVNIIPQARSNETQQDSEPNLAVNPANLQHIAATAFTPDPAGGPNAPIYVSTNGGATWALNSILPGNAALSGTGDVTVRFGGTSNVLYAGTLRGGAGLTLNILRTVNFTLPNVMTLLVTRGSVDQPYLQATTVLGGSGVGRDRVYVGNNDFAVPGPGRRTATVDHCLDAAAVNPLCGLTRIESRNTGGANQDGPPIRPAFHPDGTVYAVFYGWSAFAGGLATSNLTVVRDDNWAQGANRFSALIDSVDGNIGQRVVTNITVPFNTGQALGQERFVASNISIAVDPRNSSTVYVAWADFPGGVAPYTLHVRRSTNRGVTWSGDLLTIQNATNPALAVNIHGKVGYLYQQLTGVGAAQRWETHLRRSNDRGLTWDDIILARPPATTPARVFGPYIGDYVHLMAAGKDFHGIFSANNTPNLANFPQGVTYQRNANFTTNTLLPVSGTTPVPISIDPFYFKVTELGPGLDFYVRDWTDSPVSGDTGLEPSTHPVFYTTSDVWNRRGTLPGPFPNDRPSNEPAGNGRGARGDNWAFARIRRNAASPTAQTVRAHFLVSRFGTGSNYRDANPNLPDPQVGFAAGQLGPLITPAFFWHLPRINSSHLCLAVEISTPNDPFVRPSLRGFAPGWPTTDLKVILDNNKAQRNMGLSRTRARGIGGRPAPGTAAGAVSPGTLSFYGIVHNAATFPREVTLRYSTDERLVGAQIEITGEGSFPLQPGGTITLSTMQPGENRWVGVTFPPEEIEGSEAETVVVNFEELAGDQVVNGFAIGAHLGTMEQVLQEVLERHNTAHVRLADAFGIPDAEAEIEATESLLKAEDFSEEAYLKFLSDHLSNMAASFQGLGGPVGDPFVTRDELTRLLTLFAAGETAERLAVTHSSYLNKLDSLLTRLELENGDTADILQNVRWQRDLHVRVEALAAVPSAGLVVDTSHDFVQEYADRAVNDENYADLLKGQLATFHETASLLSAQLPDLKGRIQEIEIALETLDLAALQKAHRAYLLELQSLESAVPPSPSS